MLVIGLTGGIASGKTTASDWFAGQGIEIIDADEIARQVVEPGSDGLAAVVRHFGRDVLDASGALDRAALRARVFADPAARRALEGLLHPLIGARMRERLAAARGPYCILSVPLLFESRNLLALVQRTLVVDVPESVQLTRLMQRDGCDATTASAMLAAQLDRASRLAQADDVVDNSTTPEHLGAQLERLHHGYLQLAHDSAES